MTPQEAIDFIECEVQIDVRFCSDEEVDKTIEVFELAISALEKQIPKKPILAEEQDIRYVMKYTCPSCGKHFTGTGIANYCYHCGQALDWSDNMASFYNLDIETAFDKIRSGIDDGTWYFGVPIRDFLAFLVNIEGCEVIGNVHDNPELLRGDTNA